MEERGEVSGERTRFAITREEKGDTTELGGVGRISEWGLRVR